MNISDSSDFSKLLPQLKIINDKQNLKKINKTKSKLF